VTQGEANAVAVSESPAYVVRGMERRDPRVAAALQVEELPRVGRNLRSGLRQAGETN